MRTFLHVSAEALAAILNLASLAIVLGGAAAIYSQSLFTGVLVAVGALIASMLTFGYSIWKLRKPPARMFS